MTLTAEHGDIGWRRFGPIADEGSVEDLPAQPRGGCIRFLAPETLR